MNLERMETQLKVWSMKIDHLVAVTGLPGVETGFDVHMHIDELKVLHAIASSKLDRMRMAQDGDRIHMAAELASAWEDLEIAFKKPMPF